MRLPCNNILYNVMLFTNYVCIYFTLLQNKYHYHYHYLNKFIWITVSSLGARDNEMLRQRNIQEVVFYFVQKDKLML